MAKYVVEKVDKGQRLCIVQIVNFGGHTQTGGGMEMGCYIYVGDLYNAYVVAKYDLWPSVLLKKLAMHGQRLCNCANSQFYEGLPIFSSSSIEYQNNFN